jgi:hypothetical protein
MSTGYGTRAEHLAWCKQRALAYVEQGDLQNALASMASDMRKHPETDTPAVTMLLGMEGLRCVQAGDTQGMRRLIEGFN